MPVTPQAEIHEVIAQEGGAMPSEGMFARVTTAQMPLDRVAQAEEAIRKALPTLRQQAGFKGLYSLVVRETGKGMTIGLWESEGALQASEAVVAPDRARVTRELAAQHQVEVYEVAVQV